VVLDGKEGSNYTDVWSLTFSPDSKHLAYAARASREGKDVQFIVVDGKEGQQYVRDWSGQGILYGPVFSPDGKLVSRPLNNWSSLYSLNIFIFLC